MLRLLLLQLNMNFTSLSVLCAWFYETE